MNNNSGDNKDEDEELVVVASRGQNALADFPHVSMYLRGGGIGYWCSASFVILCI